MAKIDPHAEVDFSRFTPRVRNTCKSRRLTTVGMLQIMSPQELEEIPGVGAKGLDQIKTYLQDKGLCLRDDAEELMGRALAIYGDMKNIPVALAVWGIKCDGPHFHTALEECKLKTLGDLTSFSQEALIAYLTEARKRLHVNPTMARWLYRWLRQNGL